jgi:hypothetical protein
VVTRFELRSRHARRAEYGVARVVQIPVIDHEASLLGDSAIERGPRVRREDVKGRRFDAMVDRPLEGPLEHRVVVAIHSKDEAAIDLAAVDGVATPLDEKHQQVEITGNDRLLAPVAEKQPASRRQDEFAETIAGHRLRKRKSSPSYTRDG